LAGVSILQSGTPISILDISGAAFYGTSNSRSSWAPGATRSTAELSGRTQDRLNDYFNREAFVRAGNLWGDTGRNILRRSIQRNIDLSVNKSLAVTERVNLEWRNEFFNLLKIANFANPGGSITAASYARISTRRATPASSRWP